VLALAESQRLQVRLMGGLAFHARVPGWAAPIERPRRDIDLVTRHEERSRLIELLGAAGYSGDRQYNALHGHKQLYFEDRVRGRSLDVIVDRLEMCHRLELRDRLSLAGLTLPLADLLLSKLQIVRINRKDVLDILVLLRHYALGDDDDAQISLPRIAELTSTDWGWWRTVTGNLAALEAIVQGDFDPTDVDTRSSTAFDLASQLRSLHSAVGAAPKSAGWRLRAAVGDRVRWYQEPEEVVHPAV
jgi:hypothetical protein